MSIRIKRVKKSAGMATIPAAVHYATTVAPDGYVTGWTVDASAAGAFADDLAAKVKENYARRENAGAITIEHNVDAPPITELVEVKRVEFVPPKSELPKQSAETPKVPRGK